MPEDTRERYINPYTDFGFKKLFGTEMNKDLQDRIFQELFEQAEIARYSETERRQYEESKKVFWDNFSVIKTAREKGVREGIQQGIQQGIQKEKIDTILRMKSRGFSVEDISEIVGLTAEEIKEVL